MTKYIWQYNIWTGNYLTTIDEHVQLIRLAGHRPPYLYWARERGGSRDAITHGPVASTPKKAIADLRRMMTARGAA